MQLNELSSNACFVPVLDYLLCIQMCIRYMYLTVGIFKKYELVLMYIFIRSKLCCDFNISSAKLTHMLNILNKFSTGITFCMMIFRCEFYEIDFMHV
jgi:hypothetical protein